MLAVDRSLVSVYVWLTRCWISAMLSESFFGGRGFVAGGPATPHDLLFDLLAQEKVGVCALISHFWRLPEPPGSPPVHMPCPLFSHPSRKTNTEHRVFQRSCGKLCHQQLSAETRISNMTRSWTQKRWGFSTSTCKWGYCCLVKKKTGLMMKEHQVVWSPSISLIVVKKQHWWTSLYSSEHWTPKWLLHVVLEV